MKTYPLEEDGGEGFAVDNVSRRRVLRIVEGIPGARLRAPLGKELCRFLFDGETFAIEERSGGNARLLVRSASPGASTCMTQIRNYFEGYCL